MPICSSWGRTLLLGSMLQVLELGSTALADKPEEDRPPSAQDMKEREDEEPRRSISVSLRSDKPMNLWLRPATGKKREWQQICLIPCSVVADTEDRLEARDPDIPTVQIELPEEGGQLYVDIKAGQERPRNVGLGVLIGGGPLAGGGLVLLAYGGLLNLFNGPRTGESLRPGDQLVIAGTVIGTVGVASLITGAILTVMHNSRSRIRHFPPAGR